MSSTAPHSWRVRKAAKPDHDAVVATTDAAYSEWTDLLGYPPIPVTEDYAPRIAAGEVFLLLVGEVVSGNIVIETRAPCLEIFSIAVSPEFQGKGAGKFLLEWVEDHARTNGISEVRLYTNARMERNIAMYRRFGFQETGRRENPLRPGWVAVDMAKTVGPAAGPACSEA